MRITLAQADSRLGDVHANLERAAEIVAEAGRDGSDLVVFPELFLTGYALGRVDADLSMSADDRRLMRLSLISDGTNVLMGSTRTATASTATTRPQYHDGGSLVHTHRKL